ncbi:MAG: HlyC/CorC family transporter [Oscillospiraceae bacterium]|nr:HlyC/CorC family transporter [Oscillospiraceae bacterium]
MMLSVFFYPKENFDKLGGISVPSDDRLWWVLTACLVLSLLLNLFLLFRRQILALLHQNGGEVSENEILAMVEEGEESGSIEAIEKEMIENVFEFNNSCAEDLMIHRTDMVSLGVEDSDETILQAIRESGLSRFPVYGEDTDDILGILSTREYFLNARAKKPLPLRELLRPAYFVPESVRADLLFRDMQSKKIHMAVVVDEYGGTSGLITLEDLLEELVGKIYDEFDPPEEQDIIPINDKLWRVSGSADLEDLAKAMEIELPWDELEELDCDTVGGLVFAQLSVIPDDGSRPVVESMGLRIRVEDLSDRRVNWALIEKLEPEPDEARQEDE